MREAEGGARPVTSEAAPDRPPGQAVGTQAHGLALLDEPLLLLLPRHHLQRRRALARLPLCSHVRAPVCTIREKWPMIVCVWVWLAVDGETLQMYALKYVFMYVCVVGPQKKKKLEAYHIPGLSFRGVMDVAS